jgi:hypothetical protein
MLLLYILACRFGGATFMAFEDLTLVPIQTKMISAALLTASEEQWLDSYHKLVRERAARDTSIRLHTTREAGRGRVTCLTCLHAPSSTDAVVSRRTNYKKYKGMAALSCKHAAAAAACRQIARSRDSWWVS